MDQEGEAKGQDNGGRTESSWGGDSFLRVKLEALGPGIPFLSSFHSIRSIRWCLGVGKTKEGVGRKDGQEGTGRECKVDGFPPDPLTMYMKRNAYFI